METIVYLRFISPFAGDWWSCRRGVDYGLFQGYREAREAGLIPAFIKDELDREMEWFGNHLTVPKSKYFDHHKINVGICWFKQDAKDMIQHAWAIASLLRSVDVRISMVRTRHPGLILYSDRFQIIAKPDRQTPTKWG